MTATELPRGHVFLVGFMGAGKSTVGNILAALLGRPFVDLDRLIEERSGQSVSEIFAAGGEDAFRRAETQTLDNLRQHEPAVVACGGGVVLRPENRRILSELGTVAYLEVTAGEALARIGDVSGRPLLAEGGPAAAAMLLNAREGLYRAAADICVDTSGREPEAIARETVSLLGARAEA